MTTTDAVPTTTDEQDEADIRRTIQLYADGFGSGDTGSFEQAFHDDAWIFYTEADGTLRAERLRPDSFTAWASSPDRATVHVLTITRSGDVANVRLVWRGGPPENTFVDMHNLLKIHGVWKITNKTATHVSRAGDVAMP
jgi:ketosteroid isomerase-like protein